MFDTDSGTTQIKDTTIRFKTEESARGFPSISVSVERSFNHEDVVTSEEIADELLQVYDFVMQQLQDRRNDRRIGSNQNAA